MATQSNSITPTKEQQSFIDAWDKSILLQAGVGTGKTFSLANRVAKAVQQGIDPRKILCVTFTNRAAEEMRSRILKYCPETGHEIVVKTFHGLCAWILRLTANSIGLAQDFVIFDEDDCTELIKDFNLDSVASFINISPTEIYYFLQTYKSEQRIIALNNDIKQPTKDDVLQLLALYQTELAMNNALDFADLIHYTKEAFSQNSSVQEEWMDRFSLVQVDEMQDTHLNEYEIIKFLAESSNNLVLAGDFDQTIYEWRGSTPNLILKKFSADFPDQIHLTFTENHRATQVLVEAAQAVGSSYSQFGLPQHSKNSAVGSQIVVHMADSEKAEADWVSESVLRLKANGYQYNQIGILTRTNKRAAVISESFTNHNIPHLTVETYEFFRRQEVKDCLAYLRFILNPNDGQAFSRCLMRPRRGIGPRLLEDIKEQAPSGLRLADLGSLATLTDGDPFAPVVSAFTSGRIVIFDCETTGINPFQDDIIEIGAYVLESGKVVDHFHRYLSSTKPVGESYHVHKISDQYLAEHGCDPQSVLTEFCQLIAGATLVGHNVSFDLRMVEASCKRYNLDFNYGTVGDTLQLAKRFLSTNSYSLEALANNFGFEHQPTHSALADVAATYELLQLLIPVVGVDSEKRSQFVLSIADHFRELATQFQTWRGAATNLRPHRLLVKVLEESGLGKFYQEDQHRVANIEELIAAFNAKDDVMLAPEQSLEELLNFAALAKNLDLVDDQERVAVVTVHQGKGLEFDMVFMVGLTNYEFPHYGALKQGQSFEELRLFYVGLTRAKRVLALSGYLSKNNKPRSISPYINLIPKRLIQIR